MSRRCGTAPESRRRSRHERRRRSNPAIAAPRSRRRARAQGCRSAGGDRAAPRTRPDRGRRPGAGSTRCSQTASPGTTTRSGPGGAHERYRSAQSNDRRLPARRSAGRRGQAAHVRAARPPGRAPRPGRSTDPLALRRPLPGARSAGPRRTSASRGDPGRAAFARRPHRRRGLSERQASDEPRHIRSGARARRAARAPVRPAPPRPAIASPATGFPIPDSIRDRIVFDTDGPSRQLAQRQPTSMTMGPQRPSDRRGDNIELRQPRHKRSATRTNSHLNNNGRVVALEDTREPGCGGRSALPLLGRRARRA